MDSRDRLTIAKVACPECGAAIGEPCKNPVPHQPWRGPKDFRYQPKRCHMTRRRVYQEYKRQHGIV